MKNLSKKQVGFFYLFVTLAIIGFLVYRFVAPFGKVVKFQFNSKIPGAEKVTNFSPKENKVLQIPSQIIKTRQSKFALELPPGNFETIKAQLKFKPGVKDIKLGVRGNEKDSFLYQPFYHAWIQNLNWDKIEDNGLILWQKEKKFKSIADFIVNPPSKNQVTTYFVDSEKILSLSQDSDNKDEKVIINTPLRGNHTLLVNVKKGPLIVKIAKQDMNAYKGEDKIKLSILKNLTVLTEKVIEDDGITDNATLMMQPQEETIKLEDVKPGIYQVNIVSPGEGADSLITNIEINQKQAVFKNQIFFIDKKSTVLFTDSNKIDVLTYHITSFQTIKLNDKFNLEINKDSQKLPFDLEILTKDEKNGQLYKLESPKNDLIISAEGYFSFSKEAFFNPEGIRAVNLENLENLDEINYILSSYKKAKEEDGWLKSEVFFSYKDIRVEGGKLFFSLEIPGIAVSGGQLEIDNLEITVGNDNVLKKEADQEKIPEKGRVFQKIGDYLTSSFSRLKTWLSSKKKDEIITIDNLKPSLTPSPISSPSPSVLPKEKISLLIKILNGGAGKGEATVVAKVLEAAGFTNVLADNADNTDYKDATIRYRQEEEIIANKLEEVLKKDYQKINKQKIATTSAEIIIIIGAK